MENLILILTIGLILGGAVWYIIRAKKQGCKCIGCPDSGCSGRCSGCSGQCAGCNGGCASK